MKQVTNLEQLLKLKNEDAVFILFGGEHCNVCHALKPKLRDLINARFPQLQTLYVDCEKSPEICAQFSVFSLPTVKVYIEGMLISEESGSFGLNELTQSIERSYSFWAEQHCPGE